MTFTSQKKKISLFILALLFTLGIFFIINSVVIQKSFQTKIDLSFIEKVKNIQPPTFPNRTCSITNYGAIPDLNQIKKNTEAFQKAIEDCAQQGGGIVEVPAGTWKTGAIHLQNNINLHLNSEAIILFSNKAEDFLPMVKTRYTGLDLYNYSPMIYAENCENIAITGNGIIDGNGQSGDWKDFIKNKKKAEKQLYKMSLNNTSIEKRKFGTLENSLRPSLIQPYNCQNILIDGITIKDGPMWTLHPVYSQNIIIRNLNIQTYAPNTDGIVIDSSHDVLIENNKLMTGDDAIALKSGKDKDGWRVGKATENVVIRKNTINQAHAGIAIGSEMSGNVRNIFADDLEIANVDRGLRIKSRPGRGGIIENIIFQNLKIKNIKYAPIQINLDYGSKSTQPKTNKEPHLKNIEFQNITIDNSKKLAIEIIGLKNKMTGILFKAITLKNASQIIDVENAEFITFDEVISTNLTTSDNQVNNNLIYTNPIYQISNSQNLKIINSDCSTFKDNLKNNLKLENSRNIEIDCE
jgi:polygalacturonase